MSKTDDLKTILRKLKFQKDKVTHHQGKVEKLQALARERIRNKEGTTGSVARDFALCQRLGESNQHVGIIHELEQLMEQDSGPVLIAHQCSGEGVLFPVKKNIIASPAELMEVVAYKRCTLLDNRFTANRLYLNENGYPVIYSPRFATIENGEVTYSVDSTLDLTYPFFPLGYRVVSVEKGIEAWFLDNARVLEGSPEANFTALFKALKHMNMSEHIGNETKRIVTTERMKREEALANLRAKQESSKTTTIRAKGDAEALQREIRELSF